MQPRKTLMILGASTRAAAQSAARAGFHPMCADLFLDEDLREAAEILPLTNYPEGLVDTLASSPSAPWMYTGALENRPSLLERLAALRPLLGNPAEVVRAVRNPFRVHELLSRSKLPALSVRPRESVPRPDGTWMIKPLNGAAGRGIAIWDGSLPAWAMKETAYFQQRSAGKPISALFLAMSGDAVLVGISCQRIGAPELFGHQFSYCGSMGPLTLSETRRRQIAHTGELLAAEFGLRGIFGVDFLLDDDAAWLTEVNPRYTASVEIYERSLGLALLSWHWLACESFPSRERSQTVANAFRAALQKANGLFAHRQSAKAIVFAPFALLAPDLAELAGSRPFARCGGVLIADRPKPGLLIPKGAPLCTLIIQNISRQSWDIFAPALSELVLKLSPNPVTVAER